VEEAATLRQGWQEWNTEKALMKVRHSNWAGILRGFIENQQGE